VFVHPITARPSGVCARQATGYARHVRPRQSGPQPADHRAGFRRQILDPLQACSKPSTLLMVQNFPDAPAALMASSRISEAVWPERIKHVMDAAE